MTEDDIHVRVVAHLRRAGLGDHEFFHAANEGKCSPRQAARRKSRGVNAGVPDIIIVRRPSAQPTGSIEGWHAYPVAAALELKADRGRLSPAQRLWLDNAKANGWAVAVTHGLDDALQQLRAWGYLE